MCPNLSAKQGPTSPAPNMTTVPFAKTSHLLVKNLIHRHVFKCERYVVVLVKKAEHTHS